MRKLSVQVVEGGQEFLREVAPPLVVLECDDGMIKAATGGSAGPLLSKASGAGGRTCIALHA